MGIDSDNNDMRMKTGMATPRGKGRQGQAKAAAARSRKQSKESGRAAGFKQNRRCLGGQAV